AHSPIDPYDYAFFGSRTFDRNNTPLNNGLFIQQRWFALGLNYVTRLRTVIDNINKGYIDFNQLATPNTTSSAVSFGNNDSEFLRINQDGKVRISATDIATPDGYRLFVEDGILTEKVKVAISSTSDWADYVFAEDYELMPLEEVEAFTKENKHLPNVPCAEDMVTEGLDVAQMDARLLEKIEELTLYLIEQNKKLEEQNKKIETLQTELQQLKEQQD